jgi:hypothetical protein
MRTKLLTRALPILVSALLLSCSEDAQVDPDLAGTQAPRTLEDALFYVSSDKDSNHAMTLDVATDDAKVIKHELNGGTVLTFARPGTDGREVVVFTSGRAAYKDGDKRIAAEDAHVLVFNRAGQQRDQKLSGRYTSLTLSDDGKYAIAYGSSGNLVLQNAIEVINFDKSVEDPGAAVQMDLSFDGRPPESFIFGPSTGFVRRLAIAPLTNALQVIDLEHPEHGEISITLSEQGSLSPLKVVFAKDQFFVQNAGSPQILTFQSIENQPRGMHSFQFAPSILTAGGPVTDLTTVGEDATLRLLALSSELEVFDPRVGTTATVEGVSAFGNIHKFSGKSPVDMNVLPRAALYAAGRAQIGFVDLGNEAAWSTRNVELIELGDALAELIPVPGKNLALVTHNSNRVSVVDLEQRTVKKLLLDSASATTLLDQSAGGLRLWVGGSDGSLGSVNLQDFADTREVPLTFDFGQATYADENSLAKSPINNAQNLLLVPGAVGTPRRRIAVVQRSTTGRVTLLDAENPTPESALEVLGFFLAGLFD